MEGITDEIPVSVSIDGHDGVSPLENDQVSSNEAVTVPEELYLCNFCGGQFHRPDYDPNRMSCLVCMRQQSQKAPMPSPDSVRSVGELKEQLSGYRNAEEIALYAYFNFEEFSEDIRARKGRGMEWKQRRGKNVIVDEVKIVDMEIQEMVWETTGYFFVYKDRPNKKKFARSVRFSCSQRNYPSDVLTGREKLKGKSGKNTARYPCVGSLEFNVLLDAKVGFITLLHRCGHPHYSEQPVIVSIGTGSNHHIEQSETGVSSSIMGVDGENNNGVASVTRPPRKKKKREDATGQLVPIDRDPQMVGNHPDELLMGIQNYIDSNPTQSSNSHHDDINIYPFDGPDSTHMHDPDANLDPNLSATGSYYGTAVNQYANDIPVLEHGGETGGKETILMKYMQMLNEMAEEGGEGAEWDKRVEDDLERLKNTVDAWVSNGSARSRKRRRL